MLASLRLITSLTLLVASLTAADVPYIFTAGTPAKAAEVNADFAAVISRLGTLESAAPATSFYTAVSAVPTLAYTKTVAAVGSSVTVNGTVSTVLALPVLDFTTGRKFKITVLSGSILRVTAGNRGTKPATLQVDGHDAEILAYRSMGTPSPGSGSASVGYLIVTTIALTPTASVVLYVPIPAATSQTFTLTGAASDYTQASNFTAFSNALSSLSATVSAQVNASLNYVTITEIP